ncbi:MAG: tetratricopeptide repeat protein [Myxococcales bacterium]|nr:tetratricopeptide repeat protein [Myxococcales bacterium]
MLSSSESPAACLALVQVVDEAALRNRVPTALARGLELVRSAIVATAGATHGSLVPTVARGTLVMFEECADAIGFAIELQRALLDLEWPPTLLVRPEAAAERGPSQQVLHRGLRIRVALHRGRSTQGPDGRLGGAGVYHVARAISVTAGGQVLMTEALWRRWRGLLPGTGKADERRAVVLRDLGEHTLPGVDGAGRLLQVLPEELDARRFPDLDRADSGTSRLIVSEEPILGRQTDLSALQELVVLGIRLVSIVGPVGVGKSRLCRQFAQTRSGDERFPGGVWFVRPGEPRVEAVVRAVANVLGVPLDEAKTLSEAVHRVGYALSYRGRMLLVLDHLPLQGTDADLPTLLDTWMRTARHASFVLHTDIRWGLPGEVAYVVRPLPSPTADTARHADAVRMFATRARMVDGDFSLDDPTIVAEITALVGGLPLSIRMLAGFVDRVPAEQQLELIRVGQLDPDDLLTGILHHLDPAERRVLATCCALPGSFEAGLLGVRDERGEPVPSEDVLEMLLRRGLLRRATDPEAPQIVRYAVERDVRNHVLADLPMEELRSLRDLRSRTLVAACERWASRAFHRDRPELVARLVVEWDGLVEAVRSGVDPDRDDLEAIHVAARAVLALRPVLEARGPAWLAGDLLDATLRKLDAVLGADPLLQVRVLHMRAATGRRLGRLQQAMQDLARAESIAVRWSDAEGLAQCRVELGRLHADQGAHEPAIRVLEAASETWTELGDNNGDAECAAYLGAVLMNVGRYEEAEGRLHQALHQLRRGEQRFHEARAMSYLALLHRRTGRPDSSRSLYREALRILRECGVPSTESRVLSEIGLLDLNLGRLDEAREVLGQAVGVARSVGDRSAEGIARRDLGMVAIVSGDLPLAREELLGAVAIHRDRGDRFSEAVDSGCLGWVLHLEDRLDEARQEYRRATEMLEDAGQVRLEALFSAWLAACEAERGDLGAARGALEVAEVKHTQTLDPQIAETMDLLRIPVEEQELALAERSGDEARRDELRASLQIRRQQVEHVGTSAFATIARMRLRDRRDQRSASPTASATALANDEADGPPR